MTDNDNTNAPSLKDALSNLYSSKDLTASEFYKKSSKANPNIKFLGNDHDKWRLDCMVKVLSESEHGRYLLNRASEKGYAIELTDGIDSLGVCNPDQRTIHINSSVNENEGVAVLAHELRHAHQFISGMNLFAEMDSTKTQIQITRAMEADAESNAGYVAWQIKEKGNAGPWEAFKKDGPETAKGIEEEIAKNKGKIDGAEMGKTIMAGFKGWYNDYIVRENYDRQHLDLLDQIIDKDIVENIAFDRSCPNDVIVAKICRVGDGNYFTENGNKPELLDEKEFLGISKSTMTIIDKFFQDREKDHGIPRDHSLNEIPVYDFRKYETVNGRRRGNTKSIYWAPVMNAGKRKEALRLSIEAHKQKYYQNENNAKPSTEPETKVAPINAAKLARESNKR